MENKKNIQTSFILHVANGGGGVSAPCLGARGLRTVVVVGVVLHVPVL